MGRSISESSQEPFTTSPISFADTLEREQEQAQEEVGQPEMAYGAAILEDHPHDQHHHHHHQQELQELQQYQRPPRPSSPLMRMRVRAQEWASRMEGVDYYHDSDPEDLPVGGVEERREGEERGEEWIMRRHGGEGGHREIIMDRHERSGSDVGIEQSIMR